MTTNILKEAFEVESKYGAFFTGGNIEWLTETSILCQKDTSLQFLNIETGCVTHLIDEGEENADAINTFTSNSSVVITSHKSGLLKQWNHDGSLEKQWKSIHKGPISKLSLNSNQDGCLASGGSDGGVRLWDTKHQACTHHLKGCQGVVSVLEHFETNIFAAADDTKIHNWNLESGDLVQVYSGHFSKVTSLVFHHDSKHMISSGRDKVLILWNISNGNAVKTLPVFESIETCVLLPGAFEMNNIQYSGGIYVASAGEKGVIRCWDVENSREIYSQINSLVAPSMNDGLAITKLLFREDKFAVVTVDHNIILHDLNSFECLKQFVGFSDEILDICFVGTDDTYIAVATNSPDIKLYDNTMNCKLLQGHTDIVLALAKHPTSPNVLLSSGKDNTLRLWNILNEKICIGLGSRHTASVGSIAFGLHFAVSVSQDTCVKLWQIPDLTKENQTLECSRTEIAHQKDINCVAVSPNDKIIATASQDKLCKLWTDELQILGVLRGHKRGIWCVKFSPVDQVVVTSSADCTVKLWSITDLSCLKTLQGHESSVLKLEFLSNGMQILTAGADGFLKLFSVKTSECTLTLDEHASRVWALAVKSDGNTLITGGSDSQLIKWKDVTLERRLEKTKELEELTKQEQTLNNLVQNNELLKALKLSLKLERPFQTLKIVKGILKRGENGLQDVCTELKDEQKDGLMKCATAWNTNSKNAQAAQLVIKILLNLMVRGSYKPQNLAGLLESTLPYTERHYKRLTQLCQDMCIIDYTLLSMKPYENRI